MSRPDEGMIHAWLDGELDAAEAARVEALVKNDSEWAAAAAEARGLIAASSRIIGALDDGPGNVMPKSQDPRPKTQVTAQRRGTPWWMMRAAAVLVVVVGAVAVWSKSGIDRPSVQEAIQQGADKDVSAATAVVPPTASARPERQAKVEAGRVVLAEGAASKKSDPVGDEAKLQKRDATPAALNEAQSQRVGALADAAGKTVVAQNQAAPQLQQQAQQFRLQTGAGVGAGGAQVAQAAPPSAALGPTLARSDADEKRKLSADSLNALKLDSLSKETAKSSLGLSAVVTTGVGEQRRALDAVVGTRVAPEAKAFTMTPATPQSFAAREECYRERVASTGADVVHRVNRSSDTTAVAVTSAAPTGARSEAVAARARASAIALRVNGDTLIVSAERGAARIAIKVSCPPR